MHSVANFIHLEKYQNNLNAKNDIQNARNRTTLH